MPEPPDPIAPLVAAFRDPAGRKLAVVLVNPDKSAARAVELRVTGDARTFRPGRAYLTDRRRRCEPVEWPAALPAESVLTRLYTAD